MFAIETGTVPNWRRAKMRGGMSRTRGPGKKDFRFVNVEKASCVAIFVGRNKIVLSPDDKIPRGAQQKKKQTDLKKKGGIWKHISDKSGRGVKASDHGRVREGKFFRFCQGGGQTNRGKYSGRCHRGKKRKNANWTRAGGRKKKIPRVIGSG